MNPTTDTYAELKQAYDFFNQELFDNRLPQCLITLQRQHDTFGYFSANQFVKLGGHGDFAHEIALNPIYFAVRSIPETLSVMAREMVTLDLLLHSSGKPPRRRYRNKEWAEGCEDIGLMPSDTGQPGGKKVGDNVQTYIIDGGRFDQVSSKLVDDQFRLSWADRFLPNMPVQEEPDSRSAAQAPAPALANEPGLNLAAGLDHLGNEELEEGGEPRSLNLEEDVALPGLQAMEPAATKSSHVADGQPPMKVFEHARSEQLADMGIETKAKPKNASKTKFICHQCKANAWGKPSLRLACMGSERKPHDELRMVLDGVAEEEREPEKVETF